MGLEQALQYGLLGAIGGGAKVVQEQEQANRENAAKRADEDARTERELAIEERRQRLAGQIRHEQLPDRLAEIKAESAARRDPTESALHAEQLKQLRDSNKLPPAVKANYDTLSEQNKLIASSIYKAQAEGTYNPETAAKAEAQMTENNRRMGELLKPYLGESAPKESAGIDLSAFDKGRKPAEQAQSGQPQTRPAGRPAMSAQETNALLQQARDIKAKYGNKIPSKYFSGGISENEQKIIDAADKASPGWRNF